MGASPGMENDKDGWDLFNDFKMQLSNQIGHVPPGTGRSAADRSGEQTRSHISEPRGSDVRPAQ